MVVLFRIDGGKASKISQFIIFNHYLFQILWGVGLMYRKHIRPPLKMMGSYPSNPLRAISYHGT